MPMGAIYSTMPARLSLRGDDPESAQDSLSTIVEPRYDILDTGCGNT